jgi:hypothetical protein
MKKYNPIANGDYVRERRKILRNLCTWKKMTDDEQRFFKRCYNCRAYNKYELDEHQSPCPCDKCEHHKTEVQVDNLMTELRRKYF